MNKLLHKYIEGTTTAFETKVVEEWILESKENRNEYNLLKVDYLKGTFEDTEGQVDVEKELRSFKTRKLTKKKGSIKSYYKYAAIFVILFGSTLIYVLKPRTFNKNDISENAITLILNDGTVKVIPDNDKEQTLFNSQSNVVEIRKDNSIAYNIEKDNDFNGKIHFNTLNVPYGKKFNLQLSDGSYIYLNAGSSITYPTSFKGLQNREVTIKGEAFFEIAKDTLHPFIVNANNLDIKVYGTKFNVSAYEEDLDVKTVLVEGSVGLYSNLEKKHLNPETTFLMPGYMGVWNRADKEILIKETDVSIYTSWIQGDLVFKHIPFKSILKKLERQYNVTINIENSIVENQFFTASFNKEKTIKEVLETFRIHYNIQYEIKDNNIIKIY